ncbi:MAG TPA: hypothetical protein VF914_21640 [Chloroflexia bacterium]|jgi:hypothetical protein
MSLTARDEASSPSNKAYKYAADGCITCFNTPGVEHQASDGVWHIPSGEFSQNWTTYTVNLNGIVATCDCPHGRGVAAGVEPHCRHISRARFLASQPSSQYELFDGDELDPSIEQAPNFTSSILGVPPSLVNVPHEVTNAGHPNAIGRVVTFNLGTLLETMFERDRKR